MLGVAGIAVLAVVWAATHGGGYPRLPLPGTGQPARAGDPFAYVSSRESQFVSRAVAGTSHVVFTKSPGGVLATAARVERFHGLIEKVSAGSGIDPGLLEGIVFLESAGRPQVMVSTDPAAASGLTQILAQTGQSLLGMHIDLARSRRLTRAMLAAADAGRGTLLAKLERQRARIDQRFDPRQALAATVRYLRLAERHFGRADLAVASYHMGIGNLEQVLSDYDGGHPVPYAQLYFDSSLDRHTSAYRLLTAFGDDSSLYYWRVLAAVQIMHLYRSDRRALSRLAGLQLAGDSNAFVLHPPGGDFADPGALYRAYSRGELKQLPSDPSRFGLAYASSMGSMARRLGVPGRLYRGLRPAALDMLVELAARVRALAHGAAPLIVAGTVIDKHYDNLLGGGPQAATTGFTFTISRRYVSRTQATAFQAMLDRLQALNLIAWVRTPSTIEITVASDASHVIADGP